MRCPAGILAFALLVGSARGGESCAIADAQAAAAPAQVASVAELMEVAGVFARARPEADPPRAREARVHELLRVSGTVAQAQQMIGELIDRLQAAPQGRGFTPAMWEQARARMTNSADLLRLWTPAYAHNLSDQEIGALLKFYHSAAGIRFVAAQPEIQRETLDAAVQLGRDAVKRATREVLGPLPQWTLEHPRDPGPDAAPEQSAPTPSRP